MTPGPCLSPPPRNPCRAQGVRRAGAHRGHSPARPVPPAPAHVCPDQAVVSARGCGGQGQVHRRCRPSGNDSGGDRGGAQAWWRSAAAAVEGSVWNGSGVRMINLLGIIISQFEALLSICSFTAARQHAACTCRRSVVAHVRATGICRSIAITTHTHYVIESAAMQAAASTCAAVGSLGSRAACSVRRRHHHVSRHTTRCEVAKPGGGAREDELQQAVGATAPDSESLTRCTSTLEIASSRHAAPP